jgi:hypothetical protein
MQELLNGPYGWGLIGLVALVILVQVVRKLLARPKESPYYVRVKCSGCGWTGQVGKFNRRCNACGSLSVTLLEG